MRTLRGIGVLAAFIFALNPAIARAAVSGLTRVASGLSAPIYATHAPGDRSRLFIVERGLPEDSINATANIKILDLNSGSVLATPYLTISGIDNVQEGGLLGMAFHPDYATNGKFYVHLTVDPDGSQAPANENPSMVSQIREYTVSANPNVAGTAFTTVLAVNQPPNQNNHKGGWIGFSPIDDFLYIAFGDGGGGNDTGTGHTSGTGNAQDLTSNLLGKMLRIDVNDPTPGSGPNYAIPPTNPFVDVTGDDEIWSYGLRNPFRASFDRITGDLWIGDVGQNNREEIDFQAASSTGGENYGWRLREGDIATPSGGVGGAPPAGHDPPIYSYTHFDTTVPPASPAEFGGNLVTGGYVYRGPDPSLQGKYFFLDAGSDNHWMVDTAPFGTVQNIDSLLNPNVGSASFPVSFGEDAVGNLYIVYIGSGEVYRIQTNQLLTGDYDADGDVDDGDIDRWREQFGRTGSTLAADGNRDGVVNAADYVLIRKFFGDSVHSGAGGGGSTVPEPATISYLFAAFFFMVITALSVRRSKP
jgi:glucose/arabinose dehydrogenase